MYVHVHVHSKTALVDELCGLGLWSVWHFVCETSSSFKYCVLAFQVLVVEKEQGLQKLNATVEQGEKLYPDTAAPGRDQIRQQLRVAKELWDSLVADLSDAQHQAEASAAQVRTKHLLWGTMRHGMFRVTPNPHGHVTRHATKKGYLL